MLMGVFKPIVNKPVYKSFDITFITNTSLITRATRVWWGFFFSAKKKPCVFILRI